MPVHCPAGWVTLCSLMHSLGHNVFRSALQILIYVVWVWLVKKHALPQADVGLMGRRSCPSAESGFPKLDQSKVVHTSPEYMSMRAG